MKCRKCGTEIAEKALICYRCGTATTEAKFKPVPVAGAPSSPLVQMFYALLVVIAALLAWEGVSLATMDGAADAWQTERRVAIGVAIVAAGAARVLGRR